MSSDSPKGKSAPIHAGCVGTFNIGGETLGALNKNGESFQRNFLSFSKDIVAMWVPTDEVGDQVCTYVGVGLDRTCVLKEDLTSHEFNGKSFTAINYDLGKGKNQRLASGSLTDLVQSVGCKGDWSIWNNPVYIHGVYHFGAAVRGPTFAKPASTETQHVTTSLMSGAAQTKIDAARSFGNDDTLWNWSRSVLCTVSALKNNGICTGFSRVLYVNGY
jgi:hypothetical protein